ncbi:MAG: GNAT family N-acetyltransferase [Candidatus Woesearchaeota archaeon]
MIQPEQVTVRKFSPEDRGSVRRLCCDTGLWGKPIDSLFCDRELFADAIIEPYLRLEPEHAFVAEYDERVVGYLCGSIEPDFNRRQMPMVLKAFATVFLKYATGAYNHHPNSKKFVRNIFTRVWRQAPKTPKGVKAHLHINLEQEARSIGVGEKMLKAYEQMLRENGIDAYYGEVFSSDTRRPDKLYRRLGFEILDRVECSFLWPAITKPMYAMCICKKLSAEN